ncbi:MAG TPA: hydrogenase formation protein HypD [Patescibacteria group bacterium]|nr:hydrogenase formation protein HypD [Patescibacteria group bacterium]
MPTRKLTVDEIRRAAEHLARDIERLVRRPLRLMEVCGTHTVAIFRSGIRELLPPELELVSGPGCPVCVTPAEYIDQAVRYSRQPDVLIASFGDMLRVPGSFSSLLAEKAAGADVRVVYSPLDAVQLAGEYPGKTVIFLAVGFETTAPAAAAAIVTAERAGLPNFLTLSAPKLVPPALKHLLDGSGTQVDGFLLPGHVCAVTGLEPFGFLAVEYGVPAVVAGFEGLDILQAIRALLENLAAGSPEIGNQYGRVVRAAGNPEACHILEEVYEPVDSRWRGIGDIPVSGLKVRESYRRLDAAAVRPLPAIAGTKAAADGCRCGQVLQGLIRPAQCPLFGRQCTPERPVGACMVSGEGTCAAWYKYGAGRWQQ